jgi:hypothetical protein
VYRPKETQYEWQVTADNQISLEYVDMKLLVLLVLITSCTAFCINDTVTIAAAVKQYFRSACVYLLHDNETGKPCLQHRYSSVRFPMRSLDISIDLILPAALWPLGSTKPLTEMSTRNLPGGKGRPARGADNLTAICEPIF